MLATPLRIFFIWLSHRRWMARMAMGLPLVRRLAHRFVAGTTVDEAVAEGHRVRIYVPYGSEWWPTHATPRRTAGQHHVLPPRPVRRAQQIVAVHRATARCIDLPAPKY
jgi:hypothetical protein